jgi:hypothetical protein
MLSSTHTGLLSRMLLLGGKSPRVWLADISPVYGSDTGKLECPEQVPFRLTRNLCAFFTPFGVEGIFIAAMVAAAQVRPQARLQLQRAGSVWEGRETACIQWAISRAQARHRE